MSNALCFVSGLFMIASALVESRSGQQYLLTIAAYGILFVAYVVRNKDD